jgi:hypothetical protein
MGTSYYGILVSIGGDEEGEQSYADIHLVVRQGRLLPIIILYYRDEVIIKA